MGRRRKDDTTEKRTVALNVQLTPSERAEIDKRAARYGKTPSEFTRIVLLSDLKDPPPTPRDSAGLRAVAVEIARVGNNLNQLARVANETRSAPQQRELSAVADEIIKALNKVMAL